MISNVLERFLNSSTSKTLQKLCHRDGNAKKGCYTTHQLHHISGATTINYHLLGPQLHKPLSPSSNSFSLSPHMIHHGPVLIIVQLFWFYFCLFLSQANFLIKLESEKYQFIFFTCFTCYIMRSWCISPAFTAWVAWYCLIISLSPGHKAIYALTHTWGQI